MPATYRVYVLQSPRGGFYIGFSENVDIRVQQHNAGMSRSTRGRGPWRIAWQSDLLMSSAARELELELKKQKGGNGFYQLTGLQRL
jgi:predicted GIY-YIG superfamily endonuclease